MHALAKGYGLIEGPVWDPQAWSVVQRRVCSAACLRCRATVRVSTVFEHRRGIGGMALHAAGGLVVSGRNIVVQRLRRRRHGDACWTPTPTTATSATTI